MPKEKQSQFKLRMDNGPTESLYAEERNDLKLEKLTQKVTIISILIPVLIGVILIISYLDIKSRVTTVQDTGESGVQSLSQNLESRFSSLSLKYAALEEAFNQKMEQTAKTQRTLQKKLFEAEKSIRWLSKIKASKKTFEQKNADVETHLEAIRTDLQTLDSNLSSLDQSVKQELVALVALVEKSGNTMLDLQAQVSEKIDRTETEKMIKAQKQDLMASIEALGLRLEKQIVLNRQKIAAVKEKVAGKKSTGVAKPAPVKSKTDQPAPKPAGKTKPAPEKEKASDQPAPPAPKPGEIVEQDL
jgi:DNA repair exonuclease SbcCD ATPase subunit